MKLIAKAALAGLALASVATAMVTPASAQRATVEVTPNGVVIERRNACLRPPEFRPAFCFRHDEWRRYAYNDRDAWMRERMWREHMRREAERRAELDQRYYNGTHY